MPLPGHGTSRKHEATEQEESPKKQRMAHDEVVRMYQDTSHPKRSAEDQAPEGEGEMKRIRRVYTKTPQMVMRIMRMTSWWRRSRAPFKVMMSSMMRMTSHPSFHLRCSSRGRGGSKANSHGSAEAHA
jgi:hypothetical protein